jgi:transposase
MSAPNPKCPGCQTLQARVAELEARLAQLEARLQQNSSNSSRPPSSDPVHRRKPAPKPPPSGRKPGGQPGHPGTTRRLLPAEAVDEVVAQIPTRCAHCHAPLPGEVDLTVPPRRHQVTELPPVVAHTTEYQLYSCTCPTCGGRTEATLPAGVSPGVVGPRLQAFCSLLTGRFRLSRRSVQELLADVCGVEIALGSLCAWEGATARALAAPYAEAAGAIAAASAVNVDETPWRAGRQKAWLWTAVTPAIACFRVEASRSRAAFEQLVPPAVAGFRRTVTSDRFSVYQHLRGDGWQICWAHLARDFQALAEMKGEPGEIGKAALIEMGAMFAVWYRYRRGEIDRATLQEQMRPIQARLAWLLRRARASGHWKAAPLGWSLLGHWRSLWTFVRREGVEPTNNAAERAVRPAVLWRKGSFGHQSEEGRAFVERMLTVVTSLRLQGRNVLEYLEAAIRGMARGEAAPSLVPTPIA